MTKWVTSDWHLFHKKIRQYEPSRPEEFERVIIKRTREIVRTYDQLWFLGDLSFGRSRATEEMLGDLFKVCDSFLVMGNHDSGRTKSFFSRVGFKEVFPLYAVVGNKMLTHYPLRTIDPRYPEQAAEIRDAFEREKCEINVHGHTHGRHSADHRCVNISVEARDFRPVNLDKIVLAPPWRPDNPVE